MEMVKKESEFGSGVVYPLGLFLAHAERYQDEMSKDSHCAWTWVCASSDHLIDLKVDKIKNIKLKKRIKVFVDKCFEMRGISHKATQQDVDWAIKEAKDILFEIDKIIGSKPIKGKWE
jgi:hypothetical protein